MTLDQWIAVTFVGAVACLTGCAWLGLRARLRKRAAGRMIHGPASPEHRRL